MSFLHGVAATRCPHSLVQHAARGLPLFDPSRTEPVVLGSVICMNNVNYCYALFDDARAKGAKLVCRVKPETTLMPATALDHVACIVALIQLGVSCSR